MDGKNKENKNLISARKALDKEHYGLEDVKERILEFIAVRINSQTPPSSIIVFQALREWEKHP